MHSVHRGYESLGIEGSSANVLRCGGGGHIVRRSRRHAVREWCYLQAHTVLCCLLHTLAVAPGQGRLVNILQSSYNKGLPQ